MRKHHIRDRGSWSVAWWPVASLLILVSGLWANDLTQLRKRWENMSAREREELLQKKQRFYELPASEQERLRKLHEDITQAPDAEKLQTVMTRYHNWLKTLRPGERAELLGLPPDQRLARIKQLLETQAIQHFRQLTAAKLDAQDLQRIFEWLREYLQRHEAQLVATMSPRQQEAYEQATQRTKSFLLTNALLRQDAQQLDVSEEEVADLLARLSPTARQLLPKDTEPQQRNRLIRTWIEVALFSWWQPAPVSQEELTRFLNSDISDHHREFLDSLPAEMFRREAERLYHFYKSRGGRFGGPGRGRGFGPPERNPSGQRGTPDTNPPSSSPPEDRRPQQK